MPSIYNQRSIVLPRQGGTNETVTTNRNLLFVGANGSGKTRLGTWLEMQSPDQAKVLRIKVV